MDDEGIPLLTKVAALFGVLFFGACFQSCSDLQYRLYGKQTTGIVAKVTESHGRRSTNYEVYYDFTNLNRQAKKRVRGSDRISTSEVGDYFEGREVPVQYYGDEMFQSRIAGRNSWWAPLFLVFSFVGLVGTVIVLSISSRPKKKVVAKKPLKTR